MLIVLGLSFELFLFTKKNVLSGRTKIKAKLFMTNTISRDYQFPSQEFGDPDIDKTLSERRVMTIYYRDALTNCFDRILINFWDE